MIDRFVCLDVEMPNGEGNRISAIGITVFEYGKVIQKLYSLINPETWFQPFVVDLIGITPDMVKAAPTFRQYWDSIKDVLSDSLIVAHGAGNDLKALSCCLKHYNIDWQDDTRYLCTVEACCSCYPERQGYSLDTLSEEFGFELDHHNALSDSEACGKILLKCIEDGLDIEKFIKTFDLKKGRNKALRTNKAVKKNKTIIENAALRVREDLAKLASEKYREGFLESSGSDAQKVLGVSRDKLYSYVKQNHEESYIYLFLKSLPHDYIEENNLHSIIVSNRSRFSVTVKCIDEFLPYVDNMETCSLIRPKLFKKKQPELGRKLRKWLMADEKYTVLFAINTLRNYYINTPNLAMFMDMVLCIGTSDEDIIKAKIEFFADALIKSPVKAITFFRTHDLGDVGREAAIKALSEGEFKKEQRDSIILLAVNNEAALV